MNQTGITYDNLFAGGKRGPLHRAIEALQPGDVLDVTDLISARVSQKHRNRLSLVGSTANYIFGRGAVAVRTVDGRIYVARLKPEDVSSEE